MRLQHFFLTALLMMLFVGAAMGEDDSGKAAAVTGPSSRVRISDSPASSDAAEEALTPMPDSGATSSDESCCDEDAQPAFCDYGPRWTATLDATFLQRRRPAATELMVNTEVPAQNLNASDFDFGCNAGLDVFVARHFNDTVGLEVRYFGVDAWNETAGVATTVGDPLRINTVYPLLTAAGDAIEARYRSELNNVEINARVPLCEWLTMLGGFRYLDLDERFDAALPGAEVPFHYEAATRNRLYGAQMGGQALLWNGGGPLSVEGIGKAGIYGNPAVQDSVFRTGVVALPAHDRESHTAFIGEVGLSACYCLTERLSVRGGYRLLWVDGVALATDQVAESDFLFDRGIDASGDAFYHGAFVGLQYVR